MLKFGLDWSWVDLNYSKYTISESEEPGSGSVGDIMDETIDIGNHQLEYGMQVGPSITINPVHELKISLYFRLTPSYSMMYSTIVSTPTSPCSTASADRWPGK